MESDTRGADAAGTASAFGDPLLAFRGEFPILERTRYLVSNSLGAMPRGAAARLAEYADTWAARGVRAWAEGWWDLPVRVGDVIAPLIGAPAGSVAMFPNVSLAQAAVLSALDFGGDRDTIVMTALDFPSVRYVYDELASRLGARLVVVPSDDGITVEQERLHAAIDARTRLVAVSHVAFRSAAVLDAGALVAHAHSVGALVALDAYHSAGVFPVDVSRWEVDFLAGGVLKWLCGGPGAAFLYVAPHLGRGDRGLRPAITGWLAHVRPFDFEERMEFASGAQRWLGGTPVIPALYAATVGPEIVLRAGVEAIRAKSVRQTSALVSAAMERGWRVHTPLDPARRGGTVALTVPHAYGVARFLLAQDILVDYRVGAGVRVAPHFYTRDEEIAECVAAIDECLASGEWRRFDEREAGSIVT